MRAPQHRLLVVCTAVLALGMLGVLLLNTMISQGAFRQYELELALIHASEAEERLARQVQRAEAPVELERRARALGMVPAAAPVFLRLSDGAVLGEPVPAPWGPGKVSFAGAPGWQDPKPQPSGSPTAAAGQQPSTGTSPAPSDAATPAAAAQAGTAIPTGSPGATPTPGATGSPGATEAPSTGTSLRPTKPEVMP